MRDRTPKHHGGNRLRMNVEFGVLVYVSELQPWPEKFAISDVLKLTGLKTESANTRGTEVNCYSELFIC